MAIYYNMYCTEINGKENPFYYDEWTDDTEEIVKRVKDFLVFNDSYVVEIRTVTNLDAYDKVDTIDTFVYIKDSYYKLKESEEETWIDCETGEKLEGSLCDYF